MATLRAQQTELTRTLILDALADVVLDEGLHGFSVQKVADRAGVSHRTVYRHFPNREALLEALSDSINERFRERGIGMPETLEDLRTLPGPGFLAFAETERRSRAYAILAIGARLRVPSREERTRRFREILHRELGDRVKEHATDVVAALLRLMWGSTAWHLLTEEHGLDDAVAGEVVCWVVDVVLGELSDGHGPDITEKGGR